MTKKVSTDRVLVVWERGMLQWCYMKHHRDLCSTELHSYPHNVVCRLQWPITTVEVNQESLHKIRFSQSNKPQSINRSTKESINQQANTNPI